MAAGRRLPPLAAVYHLSEDPAATRSDTSGDVSEQKAWSGDPVGGRGFMVTIVAADDAGEVAVHPFEFV